MNKTVGELMFEGYEDPVLQIYSSFGSDEEEEMDSFFMDGEETTPAPPKIPMDKFGWFYKVGGFQNLDDSCCRETGRHGQTGIYGCTPGRATWSGWARLSPGTKTIKLMHLKASLADIVQGTHVGREIINEPWSIGNLPS